MPHQLNAEARICAIMLLFGVVSACSTEKGVDQPSQSEPAGQLAPQEKQRASNTSVPTVLDSISIMPPPSMAATKPPAADTVREGAPLLLAEYRSGVLVPFARNQSGKWVLERVRTLDDMPEGYRGKDAHPEIIQNWWKGLDVREGDAFQLHGDQGAAGYFTVKLKFATADRGVCMGLVWALQGTPTWTAAPHADEHVWATRVRRVVPPVALERDLTEREFALAEEILKLGREAAHAMAGPDLANAAWYECDSVGKERCTNKDFRTFKLDLEGDGSPEVMTASRLRERGTDNPMIIEQRFLISYQGEKAYLLGKWSGAPRRRNEASNPVFAGALDLTANGRAEIIMSLTADETQNWEIFEADPSSPGTWKSLLKTKFEGC